MYLSKMASENQTDLKENEMLIKVCHSSMLEYNVSCDGKTEDILGSGIITIVYLRVCDFCCLLYR